MKSALLLGFFGLLLLAGSALRATEASDKITQSVVKLAVVASPPDLTAPWQRSSPQTFGGSGVIIPGERIPTNAHVVADQVDLQVQRGGVGRRFTAAYGPPS